MEFSTEYKTRTQPIADLFAATFTASEGAEEGTLIGNLARRLMDDTPAGDLHVVTAWDDAALAGAIIFSRLTYDQDDRMVFLLAPVAVAPARQGKGIGQALISHGLAMLRDTGADIAVTYGDPNFYGRVGFAAISEADAPAPFALQYPEGWLGQSLTADAMTPLKGASHCVAAFNDPIYW